MEVELKSDWQEVEVELLKSLYGYEFKDVNDEIGYVDYVATRAREREGTEKVLDEMLKFLGEMPVDKYHNYGDFRHKGLRGYLINLFLREKSSAAIS